MNKPTQAMIKAIRKMIPGKLHRIRRLGIHYNTMKILKKYGFIEASDIWKRTFKTHPGSSYRIDQYKLTQFGIWIRKLVSKKKINA